MMTGTAGVDLVDAAEHLQTVEVGHVEVADHHLGGEGGHALDGLRAAGGGPTSQPLLLHEVGHHLDGQQRVVDQQQAAGRVRSVQRGVALAGEPTP
jgi:hypothetical protein